jgi:hypothetical protein
MPATLTRPKTKTEVRLRLVEDLARGFKRVDAANGVIYGAKIVGLESRNIGRTIGLDSKTFGDALDKTYGYSKAGLTEAIPMYEGATVRIDHPLSELDDNGRRVIKQRSRPALSTNGVLRNVRMEEDGLYGDIHLFLHHPHTAFILEVAERAPDKIACSHNADGTPVLENGRAVIKKINQVYSVDLVGDKPGTTKGLFEDAIEGHMPKQRTIRQIIENLPDGAIGRIELLEMANTSYCGIRVEEMDASPIMPQFGPAAGASGQEQQSPAQAASDALRTVVMAIYDDPASDPLRSSPRSARSSNSNQNSTAARSTRRPEPAAASVMKATPAVTAWADLRRERAGVRALTQAVTPRAATPQPKTRAATPRAEVMRRKRRRQPVRQKEIKADDGRRRRRR